LRRSRWILAKRSNVAPGRAGCFFEEMTVVVDEETEFDGSDDQVPERVCGWLFDDAIERLLAKYPPLSEDYFRDEVMRRPERERKAFVIQLVRGYLAMVKDEQALPDLESEPMVGEVFVERMGGVARYFEVVDVSGRNLFVRLLPGFVYRLGDGRQVTGPVRGVYSGMTYRARRSGPDELTVFGSKRRLTAKRNVG